MMDRPQTYSRRGFLGRSLSVGALTLGGASTSATILAACGRETVAPEAVGLFSTDRVLAAGRSQRIPFALIDPGIEGDVLLPADDEPVGVELLSAGEVLDRIEVVGHVVTHDHVGDTGSHQHSDLQRYYPARFTLPEPGVYDLRITIDEESVGLPVQAFDPAEVAVPLPGEPMPIVETPTFDDPSGVDHLCTRLEPCPFHETSFAALIGDGRPSALLVATPAFCSTAYCGPVVETLIEAAGVVDGVEIVHAEVYANPDEVDGNFADPAIRLAPAVESLGLTFEPSLFLVSSDGLLVDRIDSVFDPTEAIEALQSLT